MEAKLLLAKCVTLLYKESKFVNREDNSHELVREAVSKISSPEVGLGIKGDHNIISALKNTVLDLIATSAEHSIDRSGLLQRVRIDAGDNDKFYRAVETGLDELDDMMVIQRQVLELRSMVMRHLEDVKVTEILTKASSQWNFKRDTIKDRKIFLENTWAELEPLTTGAANKRDPAIVDEVRLGDVQAVSDLVASIHVSVVENRLYRTGWQALNRMLQGGFRPGEMWVSAALEHKYKTGFSQSIFNQVALYNQPLTNIPGKKPAMVHYAFEDTTVERFKFIIKQLQATATGMNVEVGEMTVEEMRDIACTRLRVNGFEIFFFRVDPSKWSYSDLFRHHLKLESMGYSIEFVMFDYLHKLPTTGCVQTGPMGTDVLDLFGRVRMFYSAKGIPHFTPHQLSAECRKLIRGTVTEDKLVEAVAGRGYYMGSSQLNQVPDGMIHSHIFQHNGKWYFTARRDRHRISSIMDEKYRQFYMPFEGKSPLADDLEGDDKSLTKLPSWAGSVDNELMSFG